MRWMLGLTVVGACGAPVESTPNAALEAMPPPLCGQCDAALAPFGGGSGSYPDPHLVCTTTHLDSIRLQPTRNFLMCADVDLAGVPWVPVDELSGTLRGNGYTVHNLWIDRPGEDEVSMFRRVTGGVAFLHFEGLDVTGNEAVAGVVGDLTDGGQVYDVHVEGSVEALDGYGAGVVRVVRAGSAAHQVSFEGDVTAGPLGFAGGVMGTCQGSCSNLENRGGTVTSSFWKVGGVLHTVGNDGSLYASVNRAEISGYNRVAGVAAVLGANASVDSCYNEGSVTSGEWTGGVVAEVFGNDALIRNSYSSGPVTNTISGRPIGGVLAVGGGGTEVRASVYDRTLNGLMDGDGGRGLTDRQLRDPRTPVFLQWNRAIWRFRRGETPRLAWE